MKKDYAANEKAGRQGAAVKPVLAPENEELLKRFDQELAIVGYSPRTLEMYKMYTRAFLEHANKPAKGATREDVVSFLAHMKQDRGSGNATLALVHASLKFFFHTFLHMKIIEDIKIPKREKKLPTVLTKDEVKALIKATKHGRNRLMVEMLYSSGLRVSELVKMRAEDIDLREKMGRVKGGKGGKDRTIILSTEWCRGIKRHLKHKKIKSDSLFSKKNGKPLSADTIQRIIRESAEKAGIQKHVTPHSMRHSFATHLLEGGENIRKIQELLGHSNLNTTQIYTTVSTEELKKVRSPLDSL
ncbi:MAG: site-specific tyrosine recombinase/integron integrase [Candidatus Diapherotrites archaeon]